MALLQKIDNLDDVVEFLWGILPAMYRQDTLTRAVRISDIEILRNFLLSLDAEFSEFKELFRGMYDWVKPVEAPSEVLPFLTKNLGVEYDLSTPEDYIRLELENAIQTWKAKGSISGLAQLAQVLTGYRVEVREMYLNVLRTNCFGDAYPNNITSAAIGGGSYLVDSEGNYLVTEDGYRLDDGKVLTKHTTNTWNFGKSKGDFDPEFVVDEFGDFLVDEFGEFIVSDIGFYTSRPTEEGLALYYSNNDNPSNFALGNFANLPSFGTCGGQLDRNQIAFFVEVDYDDKTEKFEGKPVDEVKLDNLIRVLGKCVPLGIDWHIIVRTVYRDKKRFQFETVEVFTDSQPY